MKDFNNQKSLLKMSLEELWRLFPIQLTEHKDCWTDWYKEEADRLFFILDNAIINHIGSTAIKGIMAKPIIDILVQANTNDLINIKAKLLNNGYICMAQSISRIDFNKGYTTDGFAERVFHLHLRELGDNDELYFLRYLQDNPKIAKEYESLKLSLWRQHEYNRDLYTQGKTDFVRRYTDIAIAQYGR